MPDTPLLVVRLLLDAREEFQRVAEAVPNPGRGGAIGRLNPGSFIVAHIASQDDRVWNVAAQGLDADPWLVEVNAGHGAPRSAPDYLEALAALERTFARSTPFLERLTDEDLARAVASGSGSTPPGRTIAAQLARSIGHTWAHAGELSALASLVGAPDLGLPGRLPHSSREGDEA